MTRRGHSCEEFTPKAVRRSTWVVTDGTRNIFKRESDRVRCYGDGSAAVERGAHCRRRRGHGPGRASAQVQGEEAGAAAGPGPRTARGISRRDGPGVRDVTRGREAREGVVEKRRR